MIVDVRITGSVLPRDWQLRLAKITRTWVTERCDAVRADMIRRAEPHRDTGEYARSFVTRVRQYANTSAAGFVENRRQPEIVQHVIETGRIPGGRMPPKGVLLPWMRRHGIPAKAEFPIRRKIARDGTEPRHIFRFAFDREKAGFRGKAVTLRQRVLAGMR